ncbi:MAG TPA: DUF72 domain-containing protein [Actinomycetota bacterium]
MLYVGTSGFAYDEWRGTFYPEDLKRDAYLEHYATRFPAVEINYTFRRFPSPKTLERWRGQSEDGFRFVLKAHGRITHTRRLRDTDEDVRSFLELARLLGDRLGPILFQCPPNLPYDESLLAAFLGYLPPDVRTAFEFRHPSWEKAKPLLASQGAAWVDSETDEKAVDEIAPGPFAYLRLRRDDYSEEELEAWADRVAEAVGAGRDVYCFLKHEQEAFRRADRLRDLVGARVG